MKIICIGFLVNFLFLFFFAEVSVKERDINGKEYKIPADLIIRFLTCFLTSIIVTIIFFIPILVIIQLLFF